MEVKSGYKQTEVGVIPGDWSTRRIREFGQVRGRVGWKGYTKKDLVPLGPYAIGAKHIDKECKLDLSEPTYLSKIKYLESPEIMVQAGDILIVQRGTIGKLVLIEEDIGDATINPSMVIVRTRNSSPSFVRYFLLSRQGQKQIILDTSSTGVPMISQRQIENFEIAFPPTIEEQDAIATALSDVDALLSALDRLMAKKRDLKHAAMQQLLTGETRLHGFNGEWGVKSLEEVCSMKSGESITSANIDQFSKYPCYGGNGIRGYTLRFTHNGVYTLIGRQGALCGNVFGVEGAFFASEHAIVVTASDNTNIKWLTYALERMNLNQYSESSAQPGLSVSKILKLEVAVPATKDEQAAISTVLMDMDAELAALEQRLAKTRDLKQGMMQELLTGKARLVSKVASHA